MNTKTIEVKVKPVLDAVTVRPGDTLVVRVATDTTTEDAARTVDLLLSRLPDVKVVLVAVDQLLVYRPDGSET